MYTLRNDLRFARRMFARRRRFALLLVATIAVGIGAATSIFSLVDVVLWKPLPYRDADRLYWIARTDESWHSSPVLASVWDNLGHAYPDYREWVAAQHAFETTGAWFASTGVVSTKDGLEQVNVARATASLAPLLGVRLARGRWFLPGDDERGAPHLAVLSFDAWQRRYGGSDSAIGGSLTLDAQPYEIIGVLPSGFRVAGDSSRTEIWTPAGVVAGDWARNNFNYHVFGRLRSGVSETDAIRETSRLLGVSRRGGQIGIRLENLQAETIRNVRAPLTILIWSAALLLVIACGNVGTLLVGETAARDAEISTRVSLGATRGRVTRQLLTENLLLAALGGAAGCALSVALVRVLRALAPRGIPRIESAHVDGRVALFALGVTGLAAVAFSLAPLAIVFRTSPASALRAGSSRLARQRGYVERAGVFVQAALVVVLLAAAALLVRTHRQLVAVDPGFRAASLLGVELRFLPPAPRFRDAEPQRLLLEDLATKARALPGVLSASAAFALPFQKVSATGIHVAGSAATSDTTEVAGTYLVVSPGFFETMGIPRRAGRLFGAEEDGPGTAVIVSEAFARRFWPNASAIGQRITVDDVWRDVVGVVADVRHRSVDEEARATFYLPARQTTRPLESLVIRTSGDPREQIAAIRRLLTREEPTLAISHADRLSDLVDATLVAERFRTLLLAVFAVTAVALAGIGVVGVATNAATRRQRELAIRMAVGAAPSSILRLVARGTLAMTVAGALAGVIIALGATRALRPFLFGVSPADPVTYAAVVCSVVAVASLAAFVPARRATRIDLMRTLGAE